MGCGGLCRAWWEAGVGGAGNSGEEKRKRGTRGERDMPKAAAQVRLMCLERSRPNGAGLSASPPTTPSASSSLHAPPPAVQRRQALLCPPHHRPPRHCRLLRPPAPVHLRLLHRRRRRRRRVRCRRRRSRSRFRTRPSTWQGFRSRRGATSTGSRSRCRWWNKSVSGGPCVFGVQHAASFANL